MTTQPGHLARRIALLLSLLGVGGMAQGADPVVVSLPGEKAFPESITSTSDGTLYIGSLGEGGIFRARKGQKTAVSFIKPGAQGSHSIFGVFAHERSHTLWACSNDLSAQDVQIAGTDEGSALKAFDLRTGADKLSVSLPGPQPLCNDVVIGPDEAAYVTNMLAGQILRLAKGSHTFKVWAAAPQFMTAGRSSLDGIAFGSDGNVYVNTFSRGQLFRVQVNNGVAGKVTIMQTSRPLAHPDGMRWLSGNSFVMVEGAGRLNRVTIRGDQAVIDTIRDGFAGPTGVTVEAAQAWVAEGQLAFIFDPTKRTESPRLPFKVFAVPVVQ